MIGAFFIFPSLLILIIIFSLLPLIFIAARAAINKARLSKDVKTFYPDRLVIVNKEQQVEVSLSDMEGFRQNIADNDQSLIRGELFLVTKEKEHLLLSILDEDVRYAKGDLDFFESFFRKLWHTEEGKKEMYSTTSVIYEENELF